jgi:hypothetical protein
MSLKAFHIVFIVLSMALTLGFGVWAFTVNGSGADATGHRVLGAISFVCCAGLLVYGFCFFRKLTQLKATR